MPQRSTLRAANRKGSRPGSRSSTPHHHHLRAADGPPLPAMKSAEMLGPNERVFLEAAEKGDKPSVQQCLALRGESKVDVNITDLLGRSAIEIAVDNENVEIVELLLKAGSIGEEGIRIGNALLYAIREGVYRLVEILINHESITSEMLGPGWSKSLDPKEAASSEYSSDISPVVLAAHLNQFEILQLLLSRGASIQAPHNLSCNCTTCDKERAYDSLHHSLKRINTYRALASPAWLSLTSSDPVLAAFRLSWELERLSFREHEFKEIYIELSEQCKIFACDLLSQCRSTEEVIAILNKDNAQDDDVFMSADAKLSLARLKLAIKYEQKQFVAHAHCQQLLTSIWYEGFPGRQERGSLVNVFVCIALILLWPALCLAYVVAPKSRIGQIVRSPFMKFLYYSTSFGCFLCLLTLATFEDYRFEKIEPNTSNNNNQSLLSPLFNVDIRANDRGPVPTAVELLIFVWVLGMVWGEVKQLWDEGFFRYVHQWWNLLDFIMMSLYLCTFSLRLVAFYLSRQCGPQFLPRYEWLGSEPMLMSEALFAVANVFSFARIIYLFQTNPYLGPLQISLGCMMVDVLKFFFIFFLILSSFSIGLAQLYWYLDPRLPPPNRHRSTAFASISASYTTLLWSLFSITNTKDTEVYGAEHQFTNWIGRCMFIMYHCTSIIILLNMLIAMMSHSFQLINDHADLEWKFHRTKLWMAHFDEGSSLQAPFNLVVTPKAVYYFLRSLYRAFSYCAGRRQWASMRKRATIRRPGFSREKDLKRHKKLQQQDSELREEQQQKQQQQQPQITADEPSCVHREALTYHDIVTRLVARFIHHTKKENKMEGVNEDDLLEIKQDISSLRYELRDDRRKEIVRSSSHIDKVKHDIMRTLSVTSKRRNPAAAAALKSRRLSSVTTLNHSGEDSNDMTPTIESEEEEADVEQSAAGHPLTAISQLPSSQWGVRAEILRGASAFRSSPATRRTTHTIIGGSPLLAGGGGSSAAHCSSCSRTVRTELRAIQSELSCRFDELIAKVEQAIERPAASSIRTAASPAKEHRSVKLAFGEAHCYSRI